MNFPSCCGRATVIHTHTREDDVVRRYRCACGVRFTGIEKILSDSLSVGPRPHGCMTGAVPRSIRQQRTAKRLSKKEKACQP